MATSVELPRLGLRGPAALVAEWYLPDGASVHRGEPICRVEAENVAVEVEADEDGVLRHRFGAGRARAAGDVIGVILAAGERMPDLPDDDDAIIEQRPAEARWEPDDEEWERSVRAFRYWPAEESSAVVEPPAPPETAPEPATEEAAVDEESAKESASAAEIDELDRTPPEDGVFGAEEQAEAGPRPSREFEVLPFPRRTGAPRPPSWDSVPGDSVDFASDLFDRPEESGVAPFASDPVADAALDQALGLDAGGDEGRDDGPGWPETADDPAESPIEEPRMRSCAPCRMRR